MLDDLTMPLPRRREGFPGQHHCVLPPPVVERARENPLLAGLFVTDAGLYPRAAGHYVERRHGASGTVIILCRAGAGWVRCRGRTSRLGRADAAVLPAHEAHAYGAADEDPWTIEWAHYTGTEATTWDRLLVGDGEPVLHLPESRAADVDLTGVYEQVEAGYGELQLLGAASALRTALTRLARWHELRGAPAEARDAVDATSHWMREHLDQRITLAELARRACLSPSHYSAMFRRRFGYAPIDWLIRQRIHRACSLLQTQPDKIAAVARQVGIADEYYFSRVFRRVMGVSPREFRRQPR